LNNPSSQGLSMNIEHFTPSIVTAGQVSDLWEENDVVIFIIEMKDYPLADADHLNEAEKIHLNMLRTEYFRHRYIVSRLVLKYLAGIIKERSCYDIVTCKDGNGRIHVCGHSDLNVCISYSEDILALALSKTEFGIDIEVIRSRSVASISKSIDRTLSDSIPSINSSDFLVRWTLKEASCKLSNKTMFSNLSKKLDLSDVYHASYVIDSKYLLAFVTKYYPYKVKIVRLQKTGLDKGVHY
jgi:4'-phosphopantetheinyl transferase